MTEQALYEQFHREYTAMRSQQPLALLLDAATAWELMSQLQLAVRSPGNTGPSSQTTRQIVQALKDAIAPAGSAMRILADRGDTTRWDTPE